MKMRFPLLAIILWITPCFGNRGFILTSPKVLDTGATEHFTFTLFDVPEGGPVTVRLLKSESDDVIAETTAIAQNGHSMWVEMVVPSVPDTSARLHVKGFFNLADGYQINAVKEVRLRHKSVITFIQTDKPIYKPGHSVNFRILPLDTKLKPLPSSTIGDVWIEDPSGVRVAQWKDVAFTKGLVQLELPLSNEPVLGRWSIHSQVLNISHSSVFQVEEYVLPKFEVIISPPPYILADAEVITAKICAKYTYGKMVEGILSIQVTYQKYQWETASKDFPSVKYEKPINGCYDFSVRAVDLLLDRRDFSYRVVQIFAEVKEKGTDVKHNATKNLEITHNPLNLKFLEADNGPQYFKPGLPYHGTLEVTTPDKSAAFNEKIEICASLRRQSWTWQKKLCKNFTSDREGLIHFTVPAQDPSIIRISLEAKAVGHQELLYDTWGVKIYQPHASIYLQAWFSPSGNHLQIEPIIKKIQCEKLEQVKLKYTTTAGERIKFYHQVMSRGRIVQQGSHWRTFNLADDKSHETDDTYILEEKMIGEDKLRKRSAEKDDFNVTMPPHVGEFTLTFDSRPSMAPMARLLVFYVKDNGEVVADSREFQISHCLQNKVKLQFRQDQQYPGTEAAVSLTTSPYSLCGVCSVDKSVHLLHSDSHLSKTSVFRILESYDLNRISLPRQITEDYCEKKNQQTGESKDSVLRPMQLGVKNKIKKDEFLPDNLQRQKRSMIPMWYEYSSSHVDTLMAFEEAGMVVLTDFNLETRPCHKLEILPRTMYLLDDVGLTRLSEGRAGTAYEPLAIPLMGLDRHNPDRVRTNAVEVDTEEPQTPKSVVEIRNYFPETWLWELQEIGTKGEVTFKRHLPHTITEWIGSAICINHQTGLGISDPSKITTFQPFFISFTLPYSVIRGEVVPLIITIFNYLEECLPIKLALEASNEFKLIDGMTAHKVCVCGGKGETHRFMIRPVTLGKVNVTVYGYSLEDDAVCDNQITARLKAQDSAVRQLLVEAEGFPKEETRSIFFCPNDSKDGVFTQEFDLFLPEDVIQGSARAVFSATGDLMGPALQGLDNLVRLPLGCGEQNMVLFTPNIFVLDYLHAAGRLTDDIEAKAVRYMETGYQRELKYRHQDGSYSAFGGNDEEGSMWLTAFVVKSFAQARRFISIDSNDLSLSTKWIIERQFENGCFPSSGIVLHSAMKGGLGDNEIGFSPLTAYILIALLEAGYESEKQVIKSALYCIEAETDSNSYSLALFSYATALAKQSSAETYIKKLEEKAIHRENLMYWENEDAPSLSVSIEIGGYAILAMLELHGAESLAKALPVVRWIAQQRNSNGGFISTQDTVVALQALSKYASFSTQSSLDMEVIMTSEDVEERFILTDSNQLLVQTMGLPTLPTVVNAIATGDGCALIQTSLRYNVETLGGSDAFDLRVSATRVGSFDCNKPRITVCCRYKIPEASSNMVVIEVKMVSGYFPDEWSLHKLTSDKVLQMKRHEVSGNQINFYFSKLTSSQKCFHFYAKQEIEVEDALPATAKLYDYYDQALSVSTSYTIHPLCLTSPLPDLPTLIPFVVNDDEDIRPFPMGNITAVNKSANTNNPHEENPEVDASEEETNQVEEVEQPFPGQIDTDWVPSLPFVNFAKVDHDLQFPDGIEGNQPVSVTPPPDFLQEEMGQNSLSSCPICYSSFPTDFIDIYCSADFALRVTIGEYSARTVKIIHDLSPHLSTPQVIKAFADFRLNNDCNCPPLVKKGNFALIIGRTMSLWDSTAVKHKITLSRNVSIIPIPAKLVQPKIVKEARKSCRQDP